MRRSLKEVDLKRSWQTIILKSGQTKLTSLS
jgi:hypothetical protein